MSHWTEKFFIEKADLYTSELEEMGQFAEEEVSDLLSLISEEFDTTPSNVLDVGCGVGRHAIEFADAGLTVTGIDISPTFLQRARELAESEDEISFQELDMRDIDTLDAEFDLVVCLFNTFGYFNDETNLDIVRQMYDRLTDDGVCAIQVLNKDASLKQFESSSIQEWNFGMVVSQVEFNTKSSRVTITRDVLRGSAPNFEYEGRAEYTVRLYSPTEMERVVRKAGFDEVRLFGGYDGSELSTENGHILVLAQ